MDKKIYKIGKMKDLAEKLKLSSAKDFKNHEEYLEYLIEEINSKIKGWKFHQFLHLIDVLYVILYKEEKELMGVSNFDSIKDDNNYQDEIERNKINIDLKDSKKSIEKIKDPSFIKKSFYDVDLPWKK